MAKSYEAILVSMGKRLKSSVYKMDCMFLEEEQYLKEILSFGTTEDIS